jgi:CheY-like chemotaxis protein
MDAPQFSTDGDEPCRVLIVEDNPDSSAILARTVQSKGFEFETARNGTEALMVAASFRPHVAIVDIGLPGLDGLYVARELRKAIGDLLIIAATGRAAPEDVESSRDAGFDHHLIKPLNLALLATLLAEWKSRGGCAA